MPIQAVMEVMLCLYSFFNLGASWR